MQNSFNRVSSFIIKVIALLTMTIDHIGFCLEMYSINFTLATVFRAIGRLALPLFVYSIVEGVIHTKSFSKYCLRLGIIGSMVLIAQVFMEYVMNFRIDQGNIFIDLLLGALMIKALMDKRKWVNCLAVIPLLIGVVSFIFYGLDIAKPEIGQYFLYYLRPQYHFYGILLMFGFYMSYKIGTLVLKTASMDPSLYEGTNVERVLVNSIQAGFLILITTLLYVLGVVLMGTNHSNMVFWDYSGQNYAMISGAFILLYSGKRGYNAKWFQYGSYLYYPVHLLVIYGIFGAIFGF